MGGCCHRWGPRRLSPRRCWKAMELRGIEGSGTDTLSGPPWGAWGPCGVEEGRMWLAWLCGSPCPQLLPGLESFLQLLLCLCLLGDLLAKCVTSRPCEVPGSNFRETDSPVKDTNPSPAGKGRALQNPINKGAPPPRERPMTGSKGAWGTGTPLMAAPGRFQIRNLRSSRNSQKIPEASGAQGPQNSPPWSWSLWSVVASGDKRVPSARGELSEPHPSRGDATL